VLEEETGFAAGFAAGFSAGTEGLDIVAEEAGGAAAHSNMRDRNEKSSVC
jgi:hypothetical protein